VIVIVDVALGCDGSGVDSASNVTLTVTVPPLGTVAGALYWMYWVYPHAVVKSLLKLFPIGLLGLLLNVPQSLLVQVTVHVYPSFSRTFISMGSDVSSAETDPLEPTARVVGTESKVITVGYPRVIVADAIFVLSATEVAVNVTV
jgi:hypothetical protein